VASVQFHCYINFVITSSLHWSYTLGDRGIWHVKHLRYLSQELLFRSLGGKKSRGIWLTEAHVENDR